LQHLLQEETTADGRVAHYAAQQKAEALLRQLAPVALTRGWDVLYAECVSGTWRPVGEVVALVNGMRERWLKENAQEAAVAATAGWDFSVPCHFSYNDRGPFPLTLG
jgi:hypothetical protein